LGQSQLRRLSTGILPKRRPRHPVKRTQEKHTVRFGLGLRATLFATNAKDVPSKGRPR
jgi:hypothetical protein